VSRLLRLVTDSSFSAIARLYGIQLIQSPFCRVESAVRLSDSSNNIVFMATRPKLLMRK
jgi:hypothetical protein